MSQLKTASVLAFERNLDLSDGIFRQKKSTDPESEAIAVKITEKSVRGTISNRLKAAIIKDPAKLDAEVEKANLQRVDVAMLNHDYDTLVIDWSCKVLPFTGNPCVCNDQAYQTRLYEVVNGYLDQHGTRELSRRYAINIVNGRWLWRNRIGAKNLTISVFYEEDGQSKTLEFPQAKNYSLNSFGEMNDSIQTLANLIEKGFDRDQDFVMFTVRAEAIVGFGQEVYPSQELILDTGKEKSKVLYEVDGFAAMHSQKIGNAIRTIDDWYEGAEFPVAVEPYAAVTTLGTAFRQPKQKQDFYTLFDNWVLKGEEPSLEQQHYVIAVLIRGGVFGESGKE